MNTNEVPGNDAAGSTNAALAVFPHGSNEPKLFYPTAGFYAGVALGAEDGVLFAVTGYSVAAVRVFTYDPKTASIRSQEKRSFPSPLDGSIAVFSK